MFPNSTRKRVAHRDRLRQRIAVRALASRSLVQRACASVPADSTAPHHSNPGIADRGRAPLGIAEDDFDALILRLKSDREVRHVVTPSGSRARGRFASLKMSPSALGKSPSARYESLVELDTWRVLEVASHVRHFTTHPVVLALPREGDKVKHYTPDATLAWRTGAMCLEVKGLHWIQRPSSRASLLETIRALRNVGLPLALIVESDVREAGLQKRLRELLRLRPVAGLNRQKVNAAEWDPLHRTEPDADTLRRWREAQAICDALLDRVMRRDPDEFIQSIPVKH